MKISPLTRTKRKPVALLYPGIRTLRADTIEGSRQAAGKRDVEALLESLSGHVCYAIGTLQPFRHTTGALSWTARIWKGRPTRIVHNASGVSITSLRGSLEDSRYPFEELLEALDWLGGYGVTPASVPAMAWQLFRASLPREIQIGAEPSITRPALYGGRQEISSPGIYRNQVSYDIRSAYPVAMASRPYALSLSKVSSSTVIDPEVSGISSAVVEVPDDLRYPPLPVRVGEGMIQFQRGRIRGSWAWSELAAAIELGCRVYIEESWAPRREMDLFGTWWPIVARGRELEGGAGRIAKAVSTCTWGQFGMSSNERGIRRWSDDKGREAFDVLDQDHDLPHTWTAHIAAETTARVRTRLLREGLYGTRSVPIHVDTDGMIVEATSPSPTPGGLKPGEWRIKEKISEIDLRAPQLYRWRSHEAKAEWLYNASGIPIEDAPGFFARQRSLGPLVQHYVEFDLDQCLPTGTEAVARRARDATILEW